MGKVVKDIYLFDKPGPKNTQEVIDAAKKKVEELKIKHVVVASESGSTGVKVAEAFAGTGVKVVVVTQSAYVQKWSDMRWPQLKEDNRKRLEELNAIIVERCTNAFMGIDASIHDRWGGATLGVVIEETLRILGEGFKTCIEVSMMAADAGAVSTNAEIVVIAGAGIYGGGADTAVVMKPCYPATFFDKNMKLEVKEIIAMPRTKHPVKEEKT